MQMKGRKRENIEVTFNDATNCTFYVRVRNLIALVVAYDPDDGSDVFAHWI